MQTGQGYYHHNGPRANYHPQRNNFSASPPRQLSANSLLDRISEPAGASPTRPLAQYNTSSHDPRSLETQALAPVFATEQHHELGQPEPRQASLPSEETVDAFLESVLKTDVVASLHAPSAPTSASPPVPPATAAAPGASPQPEAALHPSPSPPVSTGKSDPALLSSTRALLLPPLLANARARHPGEKWDEAEAARSAQALLTDEWCEEMIALARRTREEMRRRVAETEAARGVGAGRGQVDGSRGESVPVSEDIATSVMDTREDGVESTTTTGPNYAREDVSHEDVRMQVVEQPQPPVDQVTEDVRMDDTEGRTDLSLAQAARAQEDGMQLAQPVETMLGNAARVLQDFLTKTPRPRSGTLPEADVNVPAAEEPAHSAGPSNKQSPHSVKETQTGVVAHIATTPNAGSGLWAVQVGSNVPRITTVTFYVQESVAAAVQRWARRHSAFDSGATHIAVHLLCLPLQAVAEASSSVHRLQDPSAISDVFWDIQTRWPPKGALIVEVNGDDAQYGRTFLPAQLDAANGPVDLTSHIRAGSNTLRLIQLRDTSGWVLVVHAGMPPNAEAAPFAAPGDKAREWEAFVARASTRHGAIVAAPPAQMAMAV